MLMAPLVRRSWSLRGHTPVLRQRGQHYQKVSAIAALCIPPARDRLALSDSQSLSVLDDWRFVRAHPTVESQLFGLFNAKDPMTLFELQAW